ncbi:hypothetical protein BraRD5C2_46520 [Bradyrhizobium sp. RD5-C2]|nr:hypothetical protein BraRD5C2_46520 [Bradyrhizobium sp. RD5-C2]
MIKRCDVGLLPDFFCAEAVDRIFLAEAKARHEAVNFGNRAFKSWRDQFGTVVVERPKGTPLSVKGYIVAIRFATEAMPYTKSSLYAEDPKTPGEIDLHGERGLPLGRAVISLHYAELVEKLNQPLLAEALENGFVVPAEVPIRAAVWQLLIGPLAGKRFVGGYYSSDSGARAYLDGNGKVGFMFSDPFRLDIRHATFVGVEEGIFGQVVAFARGAPVQEIGQLQGVQFASNAISILRDGSVIGPVEFFSPIAVRNF